MIEVLLYQTIGYGPHPGLKTEQVDEIMEAVKLVKVQTVILDWDRTLTGF